MKGIYEKPRMFAETFIANQYVAACSEPMYSVEPTQVKCISQGHNNTQYNTMFLDSQDACIVKFNPGVGTSQGDKFYTQFEACAYKDGCNRQNWMSAHPDDTNLSQHKWDHASRRGKNNGAFIMHDTVIDLSLAEKYNLS